MDFRRSGQLDERRRRVLMDEIASPADSPSDASPAPAGGTANLPVRAYGPAVLAERQAKVTDFVPVRPLAVLVLLALGLAAVAAIQAMHVYIARLSLPAGREQLTALDVRAKGSLAGWFAAACLGLAAAWSLIVFGIRAHRADDYRGRYRIWLWTAAACVWLSLDAAAGVHDAIGLGLTLLAGHDAPADSLAASCTLAWIAAYGLVFSTLGLRLAMEVWDSLVSFAALLVAVLLYAAGGLIQLDIISVADDPLGAVTRSAIGSLAHLFLAAAVGLYARHVYLDAEGRLKVHIDPDRKKTRQRSTAKLGVAKQEKNPQDGVQVGESATKPPVPPATGQLIEFGGRAASPQPSAKTSATTTSAALAAADFDADDEEGDLGGQQLSRSERRRLKKLARRDHQRRAA